jgi:outer membrane protein assembly factor BamE (lipoprotein component of BamABCDE complex)
MVHIGSDGRMQRIENVMGMKTFARIRPNMTKSQVLRILGPSEPSGSAYFKARDELVWGWRYCDEWNEPARFDVLFDGSKEVVRSTMSLTESQLGLCGSEGGCICAHAK